MTDPWMHIDDDACRLAQSSFELVGRRWSSGILLALARGADRFSRIVVAVDGLSDRMAAQRLRELEAAGLVIRTVVPTTPVQVRYALTPDGASLLQAMQPVVRWGLEHRAPAVEGGIDAEPRTA